MKNLLLAFVLALLSVQANAADLYRTEYSGIITYVIQNPVVSPSSGTFSGTLINDWETGQVNEFTTTVSWSDGTTQTLSWMDTYDSITVAPGDFTYSRYDSNGDLIKEGNLGANEHSFAMQRYQRDQNGQPSPVPDGGGQILRVSSGIWSWWDDLAVVVPCGSGSCWVDQSNYSIRGNITYLETSAVPLPASA